MLAQFYTVDVFVGHLELNEGQCQYQQSIKQSIFSVAHPVGIDVSPFVIAEDKLDKTSDGRMFVGE